VVVFHFLGEDRCRMRILTGGGSEGALAVDWGAEESRTKSLLAKLTKLCRDKGWEISSEPEE